MDGRDDPLDRGDREVLQGVGRWEGYVRAGDPYDRPVERPEALFGDDRDELRAPAEQPGVLLDGEDAAGTPGLAQDRLGVERHQAADVDDGRVDALLGEPLG